MRRLPIRSQMLGKSHGIYTFSLLLYMALHGGMAYGESKHDHDTYKNPMTRLPQLLTIVRRLWMTTGIIVIAWLFYSFQAQGFNAETVLATDETVIVTQTNTYLSFVPQNSPTATLLFLPGGMVDPMAYAPMARMLAQQGIHTFIVYLPWRSAPLDMHQSELVQTLQELARESDPTIPLVLGGHSRGAAIAATVAHSRAIDIDGLILLATTHPKAAESDLSDSAFLVLKVYGSEDGLAGSAEVQANVAYLPDDTIFTLIEGGNHAQFAWYGSQLGDGRATISREAQQALILDAIVAFCETLSE